MPIRSKVHLSEVPLLFPVISLIIGIAAGASDAFSWWWIVVIAIAAVVSFLVFRRTARIAVYVAVGMCGMLLGRVSIPSVIGEPSEFHLVGSIVDEKDYGGSYRIVVNDNDEGRNYLAWINDTDYELIQGDIVEIDGIALPPQYDGTVPDEITNRRFLIEHKIYAEIEEVESFAIVRESSGFHGWGARAQRHLSNRLERIGLTQQSEQFLRAVLLGDVDLDQEVRTDFSRSGLSHVLALSGTHVAVIALIIALLFFPLTLFGQSRAGKIASLILLWGYAFLTGLSPSVVRAVIMISFVLFGGMLGRNVNPFNSLCAAALLILLFSPLSLFNVGFQLSFLAVAGILLFMPMFMAPILAMNNKLLRSYIIKICPLIFLPITALIGTAPLAIYYFHIFPAWFLITNLLIGFLLPIIIIGGAGLLILSLLGVKALWLAGMLNHVIGWAVGVGHLGAKFQPSSLSSCYISDFTLILIYLAIGFVWLAWYSHRRVFLYASIVSAISGGIIAAIPSNYPESETYEWRAPHGFHLLYRNGNEAFIFTDAKEKYHSGLYGESDRRLSNYLAKRNATLRGVYSDSLNLRNAIVRSDLWIIDNRRYLILHDDKMLTDSMLLQNAQSIQPQTIVISHGFKGDPNLVASSFPNARIIASSSIYAPQRKRITDALRR